MAERSRDPNGAIRSIAKAGSTALQGDVTLSEGANITLTQVGRDIAIASSGGSSGLTLVEHKIITVTTNTATFSGLDGDTDGVYELILKILSASGTTFSYYRLTPNGLTSNQYGNLSYINPSTHAWGGNDGIPYLGFCDDATWMHATATINARQSINSVDAPMLYTGSGSNRAGSSTAWKFFTAGGWSAASAANITSLSVVSILDNGTTDDDGIASGSELFLYKKAQ